MAEGSDVMARVAFLGLGVMGFPMAARLAKSGHKVGVWNRSPEKSEAWVSENRGDRAHDPAEAVFGREVVFLCLGDDPDVEEV